MKRLGFNGVVWLCAGLVIVYLIAGPSLMDAWAAHFWKEIPCHAFEGKYFYKIDGIKYAATRRDFWELKYSYEKTYQGGQDFEMNETCWVNPNNPLDTVAFLDAHRNWGNSLGRLVASAFLLVCVGGITFFGTRKRREFHPPSGTSAGPASPQGSRS